MGVEVGVEMGVGQICSPEMERGEGSVPQGIYPVNELYIV
jgi:hypothetical protein